MLALAAQRAHGAGTGGPGTTCRRRGQAWRSAVGLGGGGGARLLGRIALQSNPSQIRVRSESDPSQIRVGCLLVASLRGPGQVPYYCVSAFVLGADDAACAAKLKSAMAAKALLALASDDWVPPHAHAHAHANAHAHAHARAALHGTDCGLPWTVSTHTPSQDGGRPPA